MFKRREKRSWLELIARSIWPRGGWGRAMGYIRHRLQRLPDSPQRIARGIASGVFVSFTPLYGTHFLLAALGAKLIRGNILAGLLATFFGNPLTYVPIAVSSLKTGQFLLGRDTAHLNPREIGGKFAHAWLDLWHNFLALFTDRTADWSSWGVFFHDLFLPFLVGGIIPGLISAGVCYWLSVPLIRAYQNRRRKSFAARAQKRAQARASQEPS